MQILFRDIFGQIQTRLAKYLYDYQHTHQG